jgi:1,4-dihydroxy-2-naphthoyl-CoA synthase
MIENKQQTAVEWFAGRQHDLQGLRNVGAISIVEYYEELTKAVQQAKEMENQQSQLYATFCLRCANENLPIIRFKDWINLEGGEQ